jgi:inhibitor of cysteine peptidase
VQTLGKEVFYEKGLIIISNKKDILNPDSDADTIREIISRVNYLPTVDSHDNLMKLLEQSGMSGMYKLGGIRAKNTLALDESVSWAADEERSSQKTMKQPEPENAGSGDYSATNVQVQGVDEADVVKTDGEYIYQVNRQRVVVARAYPSEGMEVASMLDFGGKDFHPMELYLHEGKMVVIGSTYGDIPLYRADAKVLPDVYPPRFRQGTVKAIIFDISDKKNIKQLREVELEGSYVSSRKIGSVFTSYQTGTWITTISRRKK